MALVARRRIDDVTHGLHWRAIWNEGENVVRGFAPFLVFHPLGEIALGREADRMSGGCVEPGGRLRLERVRIIAVGVLLEGAVRLAPGLVLRRITVYAGV